MYRQRMRGLLRRPCRPTCRGDARTRTPSRPATLGIHTSQKGTPAMPIGGSNNMGVVLSILTYRKQKKKSIRGHRNT